ncbi:P-loop containing nucleoside triphosphate hydrolase protein [Xylariaceae sp. FL1651]|nr:P-loop containing nucleoside triphosphate hydrolase protein [Xylariaceae sp. FL1651]
MSEKPIFVATHPRACSTAFERVFMTRRDILQCAHEPFGDAFYYGPERLGERYTDDEAGRTSSGFSKTTYQDVLDRLDRDGSEGKRVFIKDMAYYLMPPDSGIPSIAPSLRKHATDGSANGVKSVNGNTNGANGNSHVSGANGQIHANGVNGVNGTNDVNGHSYANGTNGVNGVDESKRRGSDATGNPTVVPLEILKKYHWAFLIRHPRRGIPSYFRCCSPPLDEVTGWSHFLPSEAGYVELRRLFDYLREQQLVGPSIAGETNGSKKDEISITVLDADDLLDHPEACVRAFCKETGIPFSPDMLEWGDEENQKYVSDAFAKWIGFHNDAINSKALTARTHAMKTVSEESENEEWRQKYGDEGQRIIRACVDENIPHYEHMKSFALKF